VAWKPLPPEPGTADPRPLDASLNRLAASLGAPPPRLLNQVFSHWADIVGEEVAAHARPLSLRRRTLVIGVDQPAWAAQLQFLKGDLMARLAQAGGASEIDEVVVRVTGP
jgi:predicted nucleic acid-binding Zn ribbon protein